MRFHAGAPIVADARRGGLRLLAPDVACALDGFALGSDAYPDRSTTLVIEVPALASARPALGAAPASR